MKMYESLVIQIHCKVLSITISLRFLSNFCRCLVYYFRPKISEKPEDFYAYNGVEAVSTVSHYDELEPLRRAMCFYASSRWLGMPN